MMLMKFVSAFVAVLVMVTLEGAAGQVSCDPLQGLYDLSNSRNEKPPTLLQKSTPPAYLLVDWRLSF